MALIGRCEWLWALASLVVPEPLVDDVLGYLASLLDSEPVEYCTVQLENMGDGTEYAVAE